MINYGQVAASIWLPFLCLILNSNHFLAFKTNKILRLQEQIGVRDCSQRQIHDISVYHMLRTPEPKQLSLNYGIKESIPFLRKKKRSNSISKNNIIVSIYGNAYRRLITS